MKTRIMIWILICSSVISGTVYAISADVYVQSGRLWLFQGTLTGLRNGYAILDAGMNDTGCPDCQTSRELIFFHSLSRISMWAVRNDGNPIDSAFELAEQNGFSVTGNWLEDLQITNDWQVNRYDAYDLPVDMESIIENIASSIGTDGLAEIDSVLEELDRITETPANRFRIFLTPEETHAFMDPLSPPLSYNLEVDYVDVLLLKGILSAVKAGIHNLSSYDLNVSNKQDIIEKLYAECFSINGDLLLPNPDFLKILPADGKPALVRARQAWIEALTCYQQAITSMEQEDIPTGSDPQEDELFYIEPEERSQNQRIREHLNQLLDSLQNDTDSIHPQQSSIHSHLSSPSVQKFGEIKLFFDTLDNPEYGSFTLIYNQNPPVTYTLEDIEIHNSHIYADMVDPWSGIIPEPCWGGGFLYGQFNPDDKTIGSLQISTWGDPAVSQSGLTDILRTTEEEFVALNMNPLLGSTTSHPDPVAPRDILPAFNSWNTPAPSTVGHGIGNDPTLGGIAPGKTHLDWNRTSLFQPTAQRDWQEIYPWQKADGWTVFWLDEQLVFQDAVGDLLFEESNIEDVPGADIVALYIGYDLDFIHGEIACNGPLENEYYSYDIKLSYRPAQPESLDALRVQIHVENNSVQAAELWLRTGYPYGSYWESVSSIDAQINGNYIDFQIPWDSIPTAINGRYLTINSEWGYGAWDILAEDNNPTQIQIGPSGTLSGTVSYNGFTGAPIYIQAFTDIYEPEESVVASTMITAPGAYQFQGIGLGWQGYVRAFTPLFGLNITDLDAINIESLVQVSQRYPQVRNINLTLHNPTVLQQDDWATGQLNVDSNRTDVYAFDAIAGAEYLLEFEPLSPVYFEIDLMGRNGDEAIFETGSNNAQSLNWTCPVNGRYYLKVENWNWDSGDTADYQIRYSSDITCPLPDISGSQWVGVRDCNVDAYDFELLAENWLENCTAPYWCDDSDFNKTHRVDMADFAQLAAQWLTSGLPDPGE